MRRALLPLLGLLAVAFSCEPELSLDEALQGKHCPCVGGYVCDTTRDLCVLAVASETGGAAGSSGGSGTGLGASGSGNVGGASGTGGTLGGAAGTSAGNAGMTSGGSAGSEPMPEPEPDAGADDEPDASTEADGGCTPVRVFRDRDGDGFGSDRPEDQQVTCPTPPGFVTVDGDCFDLELTSGEPADQVHAGQTDYFPVGYHPDPNVFEIDSFDYDCSGREEPDPDNEFPEETPDCESLALPCIGSGFVTQRDRSGSGIRNVCGSERVRICVPNVNMQCSMNEIEADELFRCH